MKQYLKKFEQQVHERPDTPALCDYGGSEYTYGEVAAAIEQYHIFFAAAGVRKGQKIALCARSSARWAISFLAVNTYGAVIVPILADFTPEGISQLTNHSESIMLITEADIWKKMDPASTPLLKGVINVKSDSMLWGTDKIKSAWASRKKLFAELFPEGFDTAGVEYEVDNPMDLAIINYTSGTSGDPKGVMLTYNAMSDIVEYCQQNIGNIPDTLVSNLPLAHMYGLAMEFIYPCCTGYTIYFLGKIPSPSLLLDSLQKVKPALLITVPLVIEKLYGNLIAPQLRTGSAKALRNVPGLRIAFYNSVGKKVLAELGGRIKHIIVGGAPLNFEVENDLHKLGIPCAVGYGMTEACPLICLEHPDKYVPGSCGKPIHKVRIASPDPERVPGEIQTKGPNLCIGYYKNPEADMAARTYDGWFRTGDLGIMDEDGNVFIRGRIKALILSASGQNIYPEEVEQVVMRNHVVKECLVVSRSGKIYAMVYLDPETANRLVNEEAQSAIAEEIRSKANVSLPLFSQIFSVEIVDTPFERTAKGSIKRHLYQ
ncbi:MAG: AMP-binding protein [Bacteroidales bacterium]|nr:AMP-binding protein [Bacteroidales bacterium]